MNTEPSPGIEERLNALEKKIASNQRSIKRAKSAKALLVLSFFLLTVFDVELELGGKTPLWRVRSHQLGSGEILTLIGAGAWAIGLIGLEDLLGVTKK